MPSLNTAMIADDHEELASEFGLEVENQWEDVEDELIEDSEIEQTLDDQSDAVEATQEEAVVIEEVEPIEWDEAVERAKDEQTFIQDLRTASMEIDEKEAIIEDLKEELKSKKAELNLARSRHEKLSRTGPTYRSKPQPVVVPVAVVNTVKPDSESKEEPKVIETEDWKSIPTDSILDGVERLGAKKRERLTDSFPTLGHLMDARTEASKEHVPFASKLPEGIGEGIATQLIDAMDKKIVPGFES